MTNIWIILVIFVYLCMISSVPKNTRRVLVVQWKERNENPFEVFSNLLLFCKSYPEFSYNTLNNYLSKAKTIYENKVIRIERKEVFTRPIASPAAKKEFRMERVIHRTTLHDHDEKAKDLAYWQSRSASERLAAVTFISMGELGWKKKIVKIVNIKKMKENGNE
jgi:hypothetical protein